MVAGYDIFVSHAWADGPRPGQVREALEAEGLRVWMDSEEIKDFQSITRAVGEGLAKSKVLLAYYSKKYPLRRACQWELTAAFLAAQAAGDPRERVLVLNPEDGVEHIHPIELRDGKFGNPRAEGSAFDGLIRSIRDHVRRVEGPLGDLRGLGVPDWYGMTPIGSTHFVGRLKEMWEIHSVLHASDVVQISGVPVGPGGVSQVRGLGGMGKSLTAEEYALHFGAAYPGGIFWFRAYGDDGATPLPESEERESLRTSEFQRMGERLGLRLDGLRPEQFDNALSYEIKRRGKNCLWIVDDVPAGMPVNELRRWVGPAGVTRTLITTRSREYSSLARAVDLSGLTEAEAYQLLTSRREPRGEKERSEAGLLAGDLGRHALALDVTASALVSYAEAEPYAKFRAELRSDAGDSLELAKELAEALPNGHEASISKTMLRSIRNLGEEAQDFLRLASILPPAPISGSLVQSVFRIADGVGLDTAAWRQRHAFHEVTMASLAEVAGPGQEARTAHTLVSRTVRFRERRAGERTAQLRAAAVEALQSEFLSVRQSGMRNSMFEFDLEHARHIAGDPKTIPEASLICTLTGIVFWLAWSLNLQQKAVELYERTLGPEHPTTLESINGLVLCLHATGNIAGACKLQGELLSVQVKTLGPESHQALASMNNLAGLRAQMGDLAGAKKLHEDLIAIRLRLLGPDHLETITSMNNLV